MPIVNRQAHRLQAETTMAMPRHIICFDTETDFETDSNGDTTHKLKLGWACYKRKAEYKRIEKQEWCFFTDPAPFWQFILDHARTKNKLWVLAHNISFDFIVAQGMKYLGRNGFKSVFLYSSGITTIFKVKAKGKTIVFVDTLNWFPESLEKLGERLGVPKIKVDFETASFSLLKAYCKRDVEIIIAAVESLIKFLEGNRIARLCYTIGATALASFRFRGYGGNIFIHNNQKAVDLERDGYKGGRTEAFFIGELKNGPYYVVDVNSLYPFVMSANPYPVCYHKFLRRCSVKALARCLKKYAVVAKVLINTDETAYALRDKRTLFPLGRFWVTLTTPELKYALAHNHIEQVGRTVLYKQDRVFEKYVSLLYTLRKEFKSAGVPMYEHFCKIMLNSLYGKFGQKAEVWRKVGDCPGEDDRIEDVFDSVSHTRKQLRYLLGEIFELQGLEESRHSFPAIAGHVTAYGRMFLLELMKECGDGNYFYCDTDSLFVNAQGLKNLEHRLSDSVLGGLKIEYETSTITIHGLKDYVTESQTKIKGIRKKAVCIGPNKYIQETWPSLKGWLRSHSADTYTVKEQEKTLSREYTKGVISETGWILPFYLDDSVPSDSLPF